MSKSNTGSFIIRLFVVRFFSLALQLLQLRAEYSLHSRVAFHHAHPSGRPTENKIWIKPLPCHRVVTRARCVVDGQHNLRHDGCRHRFNKMRARSDDAGMLCFRSDHEARNILNKEERRLMTIAGLYEVGDLFGRFCVNDAAEFWWATTGRANHPAIVSDDADVYAA